MLTGTNAFKVGEDADSETRPTVVQKHSLSKHFEQSLGEELMLLDTSAPNESYLLSNPYHLIKLVN